jgi:predicted nucleotidyltransferase
METLNDQFDGALKKINLSAAKVASAKAAHEEVRAVLEADPKLKGYDVDTILIGSYGRDVAIQPGHDVDVFVKLPDFDEDPESLYEAVKKPLKAKYGARLDDTGVHALSIEFGDEFSIDAVGATTDPKSGHWVLPSLDDLGNRTEWEETDPERLGELAEDRNKTPKVGDQGAYKPIVKLIRQIRKHHIGDERPKGLYLEMLTYWAFDAGVTGDTFAELLASTLSRIADQLESGVVITDPALEQEFAPAPSSAQLAAAAGVFREQATAAARALTQELCPAAAAWRKILGENDNGWVFPLPEGCDADGNPIKKIESVAALGSNEARGFAGS